MFEYVLKLCLEYSLETPELSAGVSDLIERVWEEATGALSSTLSVDVQSIKPDQVSICLHAI